MTDLSLRDEIRALGTEINPQMVADCMTIYARYLPESAPEGMRVQRDLAYGPHPRHRLDVFTLDGAGEDRPVLVYVHGGGYVSGDKALPGLPFYDKIGIWAAQQGFIGVTLTYRLAPDNPWPAGAEDLAAAIAWLRQYVVAHGGSPSRMFIVGQSAGAAHVASYLAMPQLHDAAPPVAGALMFSGQYDITTLHKAPPELAYYGNDDSLAEQQSAFPGLIASEVPMLFTVAEHDPASFQHQAAVLVDRWFAAKRSFPRLIYLPDSNHLSAALGFGGADDFLPREVAQFIARCSPDR